MNIPELPHFDLPFRFVDGQLALVEQDTVEDLQNQVVTVVVCPVGYRDELPEFGVDSPLFGQAPIDTGPIEAAVDEWVPGANAVLDERGDLIDEAVRIISIHLDAEED